MYKVIRLVLVLALYSCQNEVKPLKSTESNSLKNDLFHLVRAECIISQNVVAPPRYRYIISYSDTLFSTKILSKKNKYMVVFLSNDTIKQHNYSAIDDGLGNIVIEYSYMPIVNYPTCDKLNSVHEALASSRLCFYGFDGNLITVKVNESETIETIISYSSE